mmetsp:Transcript_28379/g.44127  ORF Transcript_28379/g.44127 Transcript_28379/m.44127 type:complete len:206 (-) Transcript_28379:81-698(-)
MSNLRAQISGPEDSPFEHGVFVLTINIPQRYPFEPPRCRFLTPIYHPNVDSSGRICLDTLKSQPAGSWSPAVSLPSLLLMIRSLMAEPNGDDPLVPEIAQLFRRDPDAWRREAMRRAKMDATEEKATVLEQAQLVSSDAGGARRNGTNKESSDNDDDKKSLGSSSSSSRQEAKSTTTLKSAIGADNDESSDDDSSSKKQKVLANH